jgi:hypothetical protein
MDPAAWMNTLVLGGGGVPNAVPLWGAIPVWIANQKRFLAYPVKDRMRDLGPGIGNGLHRLCGKSSIGKFQIELINKRVKLSPP